MYSHSRRHLDLGDQHRRVHRFQGQGVVGPGTRQLIELQAAIENPQVLGADEGHRDIGVVAQGLAQHFLHRLEHRLLARRDRQHFHAQRLVVEGHDKTGAAHAAQLIEHQRPVRHRQRTKVADAGGHRMGQAAGAGDQAFELGGAQLGNPDHAGQGLGEQHHQQRQQQHPAQQRTRHRHPRQQLARKLSEHCRQPHWLPIGNRCRARCGSAAAASRCRAGVGAGG